MRLPTAIDFLERALHEVHWTWELAARWYGGPLEVNAYAYLCYLADTIPIPGSRERRGQPASRSELRRWLTDQAVEINGVRPLPTDTVTLPMMGTLVFFPAGQSKTSMLEDLRAAS